MADADTIENRTFDEIALGDAVSLDRTLTEDDIAVFAALSGDATPVAPNARLPRWF